MIAAVRLIALLAFAAGAANAAAPPKYRTYRNPSNSVHIQPRPCGANVCGVVVWANDKAKADSAKGGTPNLIGLQLFKDFTPDGPEKWKGSVFVPDINKTFSGQVVRTSPTTLKGTGCPIGKMGCKVAGVGAGQITAFPARRTAPKITLNIRRRSSRFSPHRWSWSTPASTAPAIWPG